MRARRMYSFLYIRKQAEGLRFNRRGVNFSVNAKRVRKAAKACFFVQPTDAQRDLIVRLVNNYHSIKRGQRKHF